MKKSTHNKRLLKEQFARLLLLVLQKFSSDNDIINLKITIETEAYLKSQRELRASIETTHRRLEDLKKQALTNENNFDCKGCA